MLGRSRVKSMSSSGVFLRRETARRTASVLTPNYAPTCAPIRMQPCGSPTGSTSTLRRWKHL